MPTAGLPVEVSRTWQVTAGFWTDMWAAMEARRVEGAVGVFVGVQLGSGEEFGVGDMAGGRGRAGFYGVPGGLFVWGWWCDCYPGGRGGVAVFN